jgi:hypothetical protein
LLDAVLKAYLDRTERHPTLLGPSPGDGEREHERKRLRRRALRQGWLLRRRYEGHMVPDAPTSPGENARVLPPPFERVPEEQILQPHKRAKRLYADDPLSGHLQERGREVLRQSFADLAHPQERRELGTALFLDRPLGAGKGPGEPDQTPLLSYEAYSRSIAEGRLQTLTRDEALDAASRDACRDALRGDLAVPGLPFAEVGGGSRPGGVSLADAARVAADFVFTRTTAGSVAELSSVFDLESAARRWGADDLTAGRRVLILRRRPHPGESGVTLAVYDDALRPRLELSYDPQAGYDSRGGVEFPAGGLRVMALQGDGAETLHASNPGSKG